MIVKLTPREIFLAANHGVTRTVQALQKGSKQKYGADNQGDWQKSIEGCLAECALSKHLNVYWSGVEKAGAFDVGFEHDVRQTQYATGKLIIHEDDTDDRRYYLATGVNGTYILRGWLLAGDAKKDCYWENLSKTKERFAWCFPQSELNEL